MIRIYDLFRIISGVFFQKLFKETENCSTLVYKKTPDLTRSPRPPKNILKGVHLQLQKITIKMAT